MSEPICIEVADYNDPDKKATADAYATMYDIDLTECFRLVVGARSVWVWVWDDDGDFTHERNGRRYRVDRFDRPSEAQASLDRLTDTIKAIFFDATCFKCVTKRSHYFHDDGTPNRGAA